jgi:hypothetical protein
MKKSLLFIYVMLIYGSSFALTPHTGETLKVNSDNPAPDDVIVWVIPDIGASSGNTRAPGNTWRYQRTEYLIKPSEMAAACFPTGAEVTAISFIVGTAGGTSQTGTLNIWLKNTTDNSYTLGSNWTVAGFTQVSNSTNWTVPIAVGSYMIPFSGGSSFIYTGSGVYVAWEFSNPSGTLGNSPAVLHKCDNTVVNSLMGGRSNTSLPNGLAFSNFRPATALTYTGGSPPVAYTVSGGGSYCIGSGGLSLGLDDSETCVSYELYKNSVATGNIVAGTGSSITFGNQTAGTYTVLGTNASGSTWMTGNAMITEIPFPGDAGPISGNHHVPLGSSVNPYSVGTITDATSYVWTYTGTGVTINNNGIQNVTLDFLPMATNGQLKVMGQNSCGNGMESFFDIIIDAPACATTTWTGDVDENWHNPGNWTNYCVPQSTTDVAIQTGRPHYPTLSTAGACNDLTMESETSLLGNAFLTIGGSTTIKRNITGNGIDPSSALWHYIGSPTSSGTAATFTGGLVNSYNETSQQWDAVTNPSTSLETGKGYSAAMPSTGEVIYTGGFPNFGDKVISGLTYTPVGNPDYVGWHLLGNCFPSALDWDLGNWNRVNVDATVYTWDASAGQYLCWPSQSGFGTLADGIIPPEQGFMVHVSGTGTSSITIPEEARMHGTQTLYKSLVTDLLELEIRGNDYKDKTFIHFMVGTTPEFDPEFDAYKLLGIDEAPQLYSMNQDTKFAINVMSPTDKNPVIPIGLRVGAGSTYTITASGIANFASGTNIYLEDLRMNKTINLNQEPEYSFNAFPGDDEHRFNLLFNLVGLPDSQTGMNVINIYSSGKDVYVNIPFDLQGDINIYSMIGNWIYTVPVKENSLNKITMKNAGGYYIVKVIGNTGTRTAKVFIN